jgi:hypothetical protein
MTRTIGAAIGAVFVVMFMAYLWSRLSTPVAAASVASSHVQPTR